MPDYTLCSGVHVCWSEHSDSSFVYGFMSLDYGFGTMTATTYEYVILRLHPILTWFPFCSGHIVLTLHWVLVRGEACAALVPVPR